ncbi:MAG: bifunctional sulfate adenylyltransferase/adenylylsulfate kinase [Candidatus Marinimicrobia bacterium]|nr:bifunctional sulfate adenylyltransferase/adenylylsulfate kinase [Candidatus Neomarinimicrobiota bacterium]
MPVSFPEGIHAELPPHGGKLVNLLSGPDRAAELKAESIQLPSLKLNDRQICDLELLLNGGFSPLTGFMGSADVASVVGDMHLADGTLWPMPVTLDVSDTFGASLSTGDRIILRDEEGYPLSILTVTDIWRPDLKAEAEQVFGTSDATHPGVRYLLDQSGPVYLGGTLEGIALPMHYDYQLLRHTPQELRDRFAKHGWERVVAFQTRNPMHRAHVELTHRAANEAGASLLIHPVVGLTKPGDVNHYTRVRCYEEILHSYPTGTAMLSLLPLAMRMGGPREALWHAIIRKNYGCSHFIVGRDHAGPGNDSQGNPFYGPYDAQELLRKHEAELGITMVPFKMMVYVEDRAEYMAIDEVPEGTSTASISGTELRRRLEKGLEIPEWFSYPKVVAELRRSQPPLTERGFTVFFTGLSGAGKSTLANGLMVKLLEDGRRPVTLLDGDIVRTHLSSELGFSKEHRAINVQRIGFVASEITKNGGIAICAPIAPYEADRRINRDLISAYGGYIEVHVSTPLAVCEERDVKGLYAKARQGLLKGFTGIDDPYEEPTNAEIVIDSSDEAPETLVQAILLGIEQLGYM